MLSYHQLDLSPSRSSATDGDSQYARIFGSLQINNQMAYIKYYRLDIEFFLFVHKILHKHLLPRPVPLRKICTKMTQFFLYMCNASSLHILDYCLNIHRISRRAQKREIEEKETWFGQFVFSSVCVLKRGETSSLRRYNPTRFARRRHYPTTKYPKTWC